MGDTLAFRSDEGRGYRRYASGELETSYDPEVSE